MNRIDTMGNDSANEEKIERERETGILVLEGDQDAYMSSLPNTLISTVSRKLA